ncbi:MAG: hypothetical protein V1709_08690 [Planctomycetota bacterium]
MPRIKLIKWVMLKMPWRGVYPVISGGAIILLLGLMVTAGYGGCGGGGGSGGSSVPTAIIPNTTKVITSSPTEISGDNSVITFSATAADVKKLAVDDVMVGGVSAQAPNGFLRKVSSTNEISGQIIVNTTQAILEDAIQDGIIELNKSLSPDEVNQSIAIKGVTIKAIGGTFSPPLDNVVLWDADNNPDTTYDQIIANGSITFSAGIDFRVKIASFQIKEIRSVLNLNETAQLTISSNINFPPIDETKRIATYSFTPITIWVPSVPPLPVVLTPILTVDVGINGQVEVSITTGITQESNLSVGLQYNNSVWSPVNSLTKSFDYTPPTLSAGLGIQGYIQPQMNLLIYGVAGPYADAKGYLQLDANVLNTPWWQLYGGIEAGAGVKLSALGQTIANYELLKIIDYEILLAQAPIETVSTPNLPTGTISGTTGTSYDYSTGGASSDLGHAVEYQFDWGDGNYSDWSISTTVSKSWSSANTYIVKAQARCAAHTSVSSTWSSGLSVTINLPETVSAPTQPTGIISGTTGTSYDYSTGGASSNLGHAVEYQFDWGDGSYSDWSTSTTVSKSWSSANTYIVKAQARCATHTSVSSTWSSGLSVTINLPDTVSAPTQPTGIISGTTGTSYDYSTGGASSDLGHTVEYQFDWGDGNYSDWSTSTTVSKSWSSANTYIVKAQARCVTHTSVTSTWSSGLSVNIFTEPTAVDDYVWVANTNSANVTRIQKSNSATTTIGVGTFPYSVAVDGIYCWVANYASDSVTRILKSNLSKSTIGVGDAPRGVAVDDAYCWVVNQATDNVTRIQKATSATTTITVGDAPFGVAVDATYCWVANYNSNNVTRILKSDLSTTTIAVGTFPAGVAVDATYCWVANYNSATVTRIVKSTLATTTIAVGTTPEGVAVDETYCWVANYGSNNVTRILKSDLSTTTIAVGTTPEGVAVDGTYCWVANYVFSGNVTRILKSDLTTTTIAVGTQPISLGDMTGYAYDNYAK